MVPKEPYASLKITLIATVIMNIKSSVKNINHKKMD
jgi:hypothetical protein